MLDGEADRVGARRELRPGDPRGSSHKGFDLLAWWLPIVGVLAGALVLAFGVWRWSRRREPEEPVEPPDSGLDEETERRLDDLLARFD